MPSLHQLLSAARVIDLAQSYFVGMPHHPNHPPFLFSLVKQHGEYIGPQGNSSAADAIALGTHVGTHIDALSHFSCDGKLHGGQEAAAVQSYAGGMQRHSIEDVPPILRRGVLLDLGTLARDHEVTPEELERVSRAQGVEIREGDVVLLRTGWAERFHDPRQYIDELHSPGPCLAGAKWLSSRKVYAVGSDTVAFERLPDPAMPVHVHLLVESGIHIIELLNLDELAAAKAYEFTFVALPLKIRGATGSPVRPIALIG